MTTTIVLLAKAPSPGRSKTRLCPPCTYEEAAWLAEAAIADTMRAICSVPCRPVVALDGDPGSFLPAGVEVIRQRAGGLARRLAGAFEDVGAPALLVGMDSPQVTPSLLRSAVTTLGASGVDAVLGPALDGGYWIIGLNRIDAAIFDGVPMSTDRTCAVQRRRLREQGFRTIELPALRDIDEVQDARAVATAAPHLSFARRWRQVEKRLQDGAPSFRPAAAPSGQ